MRRAGAQTLGCPPVRSDRGHGEPSCYNPRFRSVPRARPRLRGTTCCGSLAIRSVARPSRRCFPACAPAHARHNSKRGNNLSLRKRGRLRRPNRDRRRQVPQQLSVPGRRRMQGQRSRTQVASNTYARGRVAGRPVSPKEASTFGRSDDECVRGMPGFRGGYRENHSAFRCINWSWDATIRISSGSRGSWDDNRQ